MVLLCFNTANAQQNEYYPYFSRDTLRVFKIAAEHRNAFNAAMPLPAGVSSAYKNHYKKIVNSGADHVYEAIRYTALADTVVEPFVDKVYQRIIKANKNLPPTSLYLTRNTEENAYAMLDGTMFMNIGLVAKLENESQLAFIICHELAHAYFKHTQRSLKKELDALYDPKFRAEVKKIVKEEYNMSSKLESLVRNVSLNALYHDRKDEKQADSLGYVLLANSGYDASQAYSALKLLDNVDEPYSKELLDLQKFFTCPEFSYAFINKPVKTKSIFNIKPDTSVLQTSDTLKTHPDCAKRMRFITKLMQEKPAPQPSVAEDQLRFSRVKAVSRREVVQSLFDFGFYDEALFTSLLLLREEPESAYLNAMVTLSLFELKKHLENHTYSEVVNTLSDYRPENFNQFLANLHNLKVSDFRSFAACFNESFKARPDQNEYTLAARYTFLMLKDTVSEAAELKKQYYKNYKGGRFEKLFFAEGPAAKKK